MATLDIDFNCMCLFVTGDDPDLVHVLLPSTAGHEQHVVRMVYQNLDDKTVIDRDMTGWALELHGAAPEQQQQQQQQKGASNAVQKLRSNAGILNLSDVTGHDVDPDLVGADLDKLKGKVVSRITIRGGEMGKVKVQDPVEEQNVWEVKGEKYVMAHQTTWRIRNVPDRLEWKQFGDGPEEVPLESLTGVKPEKGNGNGNAHYRLRVYHVLQEDLPNSPEEKVAQLGEEKVMHHFRAYYPLVNLPHPDDRLVPARPADPDRGGTGPHGMHYCKNAQALT